MSLRRKIDQLGTLSFRLTLLYGCVFILSSLAAFSACYLAVGALMQKNMDEHLLEEAEEYTELLSSQGIEAVKKEIREEEKTEDVEEIYIRLVTLNGTTVIDTNPTSWDNLEIRPSFLDHLRRKGQSIFETRSVQDKPYKVRFGYTNIGGDLILHTGELMETEAEVLEVLKQVFGTTVVVVVIVAALIGWLMARHALSGIEEVTQTAWRISKGVLDQRVPAKNRGKEIERLASIFNLMLDNIENVIKEMKEINDSIAHDLKSPITRIRGIAEVTLTTNSNLSEYRKMAASTIEECDNLLTMINTMLDIAETEAGAGEIEFKRVDMTALVGDLCDMYQPIIDVKGLSLKRNIFDSCRIYGDFRKLQTLLANLLDNAVKYTESSGRISVGLEIDSKDCVILSVEDTGIGISEKDLPYVFNRFYRCDRSRTRSGNGLGLSLVKAVAKSHSGRVHVESHIDRGSRFIIAFPRPAMT